MRSRDILVQNVHCPWDDVKVGSILYDIILLQAKATLGEMRVRYNQIKKELEGKIQIYKEAIKYLKNTEKKIQVFY